MEPSPSTTWVTLATLLRPQGRKGEILAELLTDFPEHFANRSGLTLRGPDGALQPGVVEGHWLPVGRNAGRVVLKLEGINTIEAAERLSTFELIVPEDQRVALNEEDEARYISDLLDCTVFDRGKPVGLVHDIHFPTTATGNRVDEAAPLLVIHSPAGEELLVPFARAWIETIDIPNKRLTMTLPEGLLDINAPVSRSEPITNATRKNGIEP